MQRNNKLRQKLRSSKSKHTQVKIRPNRVSLTATEVLEKVASFLRSKAVKVFSASQNRDRHKRSPWLVEQLRHKAELKRERILQRNLNVECFKHKNYNGV